MIAKHGGIPEGFCTQGRRLILFLDVFNAQFGVSNGLEIFIELGAVPRPQPSPQMHHFPCTESRMLRLSSAALDRCRGSVLPMSP